MYENEPDVKKVIDTARGIEGLVRTTGVHACAVILSKTPLLDLIPLHRRDKDGVIITGFDYPSCESMGMIKMDFLGLRNLGIIDHAMKVIKDNRGIELSTESIPLDDTKTYELLARGDTLGVFQLDGGPMRQLLKLMEPTRFEDIAAVLALYRPGPMAANAHTNYAHRKNGRQAIEPIHPELADALEPILGTTFHLLVYQEQIMAIARQLAGYTLGGADVLRRAMGKKKPAELAAQYEKFHQGMVDNSYSEESIKALWDVMLPFSGYAFNKSHTAGYGLVSYWTAYLKANYPAEYMAALLTSVGRRQGQGGRLPRRRPQARHQGAAAGRQRVGRGLHRRRRGRPLRPEVGAERGHRRHRLDGRDPQVQGEVHLVLRLPAQVRDQRAEQARGGIPHQGRRVRQPQPHPDGAVRRARHRDRRDHPGEEGRGVRPGRPVRLARRRGRRRGPAFGLDVAIGEGEWPRKQLLAIEREMLGLYVSAHPLDGAEHILARNRDTSIADLLNSGQTQGVVKISGLITGVERRMTKQGNAWAIVHLSDRDASIEVCFFPASYQLVQHALLEDSVVAVSGRINDRDGSINIAGQELTEIDISSAEHGGRPPVQLLMRAHKVNQPAVAELKRILSAHPGESPVRVRVQSPVKTTVYELGFLVNHETIASDIKGSFGAEAWLGLV